MYVDMAIALGESERWVAEDDGKRHWAQALRLLTRKRALLIGCESLLLLHITKEYFDPFST